MVPHTDDGRVLFVIPWHPPRAGGHHRHPHARRPTLEPRALPEEIDFILRNANRYLTRDPTRDDVLSVFRGAAAAGAGRHRRHQDDLPGARGAREPHRPGHRGGRQVDHLSQDGRGHPGLRGGRGRAPAPALCDGAAQAPRLDGARGPAGERRRGPGLRNRSPGRERPRPGRRGALRAPAPAPTLLRHPRRLGPAPRDGPHPGRPALPPHPRPAARRRGGNGVCTPGSPPWRPGSSGATPPGSGSRWPPSASWPRATSSARAGDAAPVHCRPCLPSHPPSDSLPAPCGTPWRAPARAPSRSAASSPCPSPSSA